MLCLLHAQASNPILGLLEALAVPWSLAGDGCKGLACGGMALPTAMLPHNMPPGLRSVVFNSNLEPLGAFGLPTRPGGQASPSQHWWLPTVVPLGGFSAALGLPMAKGTPGACSDAPRGAVGCLLLRGERVGLAASTQNKVALCTGSELR